MSTKYEDKKKTKSNLKISRKSNKKTTSKIVNVKITEIKPIINNKKPINQSTNVNNVENVETTTHDFSKQPKKNKRAIKMPKGITTTENKLQENNQIENKIEEKIETKVENEVNENIKKQTLNLDKLENNIEQQTKRNLKLNINQEKNQEVYKKPDISINQNSSFFYTPSIFSRYNINITSVDDDLNTDKSIDVTNQETDFISEGNKTTDNSDNLEVAKTTDDNTIDITDETNNIDFSDISLDDIIELSENINENSNDNNEFFNSSSETIKESNKIKDSDKSYISKVKKGIFTNISSVFKKFSYEQNEMMDLDKINNMISPLEPNISYAPQTAPSPSQNNVSIDMNSIDFEENATSSKIDLTSTNNIIDSSLNDNINNNIDSTNEIINNNSFLDDDNMFNLNNEEYESFNNINYSDINLEENASSSYDESNFSIEDYFGVNSNEQPKKIEKIEKEKKPSIIVDNIDNNIEETKNTSSINQTIIDDIKKEENEVQEKLEKISSELSEKDFSSLSKLLNNVNEKINSISDRLSEIENSKIEKDNSIDKTIKNNIVNEPTDDISDTNNIEDIDLDSINLNDLDITPEELDTLAFVTGDQEETKEQIVESDNNTAEDIENILSQTFSKNNNNIDENMKNELLTEILNTEDIDTLPSDTNNIKENSTDNKLDENDDFFTIIDTLAKTITQLESSADINNTNSNKNNSEGKTINILINKDDIFSISILNETYEIVADFDGISVLSENINISTPKKNFYVTVGEKYIEIHNNGSNFLVNTNFEDIEFANAINNVAFTKKNNKIELTVKEAFKLSSINNKVELSMLNTSVADMKSSNVETSETINESSICDNRTLLISEETQKVYLPYTIEELMQKLNNSDEYQTLEDVIENEYTVPLSTFKMPIVSRFKEAYKFMRTKEHSSVYAALDLALELMFNSNLNPAVIRASKDLKELNVYLDCLYENEIDKFDCFKIVYKVLPKIK